MERRYPRAMLAYAKVYLRIKARLPQNPRVRYIVHPAGLEDNLSTGAYESLRLLAQTILSSRKDITLARNPMVFKQYPYPVESHEFSFAGLAKLKRGDILTADGTLLSMEGDECAGMKEDKVKKLVRAAEARGVIAMLWRPEQQGGRPCSRFAPPWNQRTFRLVGRKYMKRLLGE